MAQQKSIVYQDQSISYIIEGSGQPVMLVHGFSEDGSVWEKQVEALKDQFMLIVPDLPGSGASPTKTPNTSHWSMEYFADCLQAILQNEGVSLCTMIGHSMGGYVTLAFVEKYSDQLKGFGLFHSTAAPDSQEKIATRRRGIEFINQNGPAKFLEQSIPNLYSDETKKQHPELVQKNLSQFTNFPAHSLVGYYEAMILRPDRVHLLKNYSRPVLFIIGKFDTAVPMEQSLQQSHLPGISYVHILEHSGHMGMWEEPDLSNTYLKNFLLDIDRM